MEIVEFLGALVSRDLIISAVLFVCLWRVWAKLCAVLDRVTEVIAQSALALNGLKDEIAKCPIGRRPASGSGERERRIPKMESVANELYLARAPNAAKET